MPEILADVQARYPVRELRYADLGWQWIDTGAKGPALVLLPGSAANALMFARLLSAYGQRWRMISVTPPALWQPEELAKGLEALLEHIAVPEAVVVGSSFGAYWGAFFARNHPKRVQGLLLGNGFIDAADLASHPLFNRQQIETAKPADLHAQWRDRIASAPASDLQILQLRMIEQKSPESLHAHFLAVVRAQPCPGVDLPPDRFVALDCADDPVISETARKRVRAHFPSARHLSLSTGGHYPHILNAVEYDPVLSGLVDRAFNRG